MQAFARVGSALTLWRAGIYMQTLQLPPGMGNVILPSAKAPDLVAVTIVAVLVVVRLAGDRSRVLHTSRCRSSSGRVVPVVQQAVGYILLSLVFLRRQPAVCWLIIETVVRVTQS